MKIAWKKVIITGLVLGAIGSIPIAVFASQSNDKVAVCHHTESETNPWVSIDIDVNALQAHLNLHDVDFVIIADKPCPPETETNPSPTPSVTPTEGGDTTSVPQAPQAPQTLPEVGADGI